MRCPACGGDIATGVERCTHCDTPLPVPSAPGVVLGFDDDPMLVETRFAEIPTARDAPVLPPVSHVRPGKPRQGLRGYAGWLLAGVFALALAAVLIVLWPSDRPRQGTATGNTGPAAPPRSQAAPQSPSGSPASELPEVGRERFFVDTFARAEGYASPGTSGDAVGALRKGKNYVFCKRWGQRMERNGGEDYNHWWLLTNLDEVYADGAAARAWVSALYLTHWGNDEARDDTGRDIPDCPQ